MKTLAVIAGDERYSRRGRRRAGRIVRVELRRPTSRAIELNPSGDGHVEARRIRTQARVAPRVPWRREAPNGRTRRQYCGSRSCRRDGRNGRGSARRGCYAAERGRKLWQARSSSVARHDGRTITRRHANGKGTGAWRVVCLAERQVLLEP